MAAAITYATNVIPDSITNPDVDFSVAKDNNTPFSFLEFITTTRVDYSPEEYNNFYLTYLKEWSLFKNNTRDKQSASYVDHYLAFIKEIIVTFTTVKERKFLNSLNFEDPADLDVAIPFFVEKIRDVILFYKNKRDDVKYSIDRNKIKGTETSIEKGLYDNIYNYVFSAQDDPQYTTLGLSLSSVSKYLKIDIEEYVDVYGSYFDSPLEAEDSDFNAANGSAKSYYTANFTPIEAKLFFTESQYGEIFGSVAFLREIPLIANVNLKFDPICDPNNPLTLIDNSKITGLTNSDILILKKKLLQKFLGTDIYYTDTTGVTPISGILIKASNPSSNIHNLQAASTPTVRSSEIKLLRELGLFFNTDSQGIFQLNSNNFSYSLDESKLEPNKVYIYPDPSRFGNVTVNSLSTFPLVFIHDYRPDIKNISSGQAIGSPKVYSDDQTFSAYYAVDQSRVNSLNDFELNINLSDLYNKGYITKLQYDIYGNEYALFKDEFGQTFKSLPTANQDITPETAFKYIQLDGYIFKDPNFGYNFAYEFTTRTVTNTASPNYAVSNPYYTLNFRDLYPYDWFEITPAITLNTFDILDSTLISPPLSTNIPQPGTGYILKDGNGFTFEDKTPLSDPIYAGYTNYPGDFEYYYSELLEGGVSSLTPPTIARDYATSGSLSAIFTLNVSNALSSGSVSVFDGGDFTTIYTLLTSTTIDDVVTKDIYNENIPVSNIVFDTGLTAFSTLEGDNVYKAQAHKEQLQGKIYVKSDYTGSSLPVSVSLSSVFTKYNESVKSEIFNKPKDLEVFYDTICVETPSYLVFDKVIYENGVYTQPNTSNTVYTVASGSALNVFSQRFFNEREKTILFCKMVPAIIGESGQLVTDITNIELINSTEKLFLPYVYQYSITSNITTQLFPSNTEIAQLSGLFTLTSNHTTNYNFNPVRIKKPIITYNSLNDIYKLVYILTDNNSHFHLIEHTFDITTDQKLTFIASKLYKNVNTVRTTDYINTSFATISPSSTITLSGSEIII